MIAANKFDEDYGCPVHGKQIHLGDGGTGCYCPEYVEEMADVTQIHNVEEEEEIENDFCKRCGKSHKTSWCK